MALKPYFGLGQAKTSQSREQVFHCGQGPAANLQGRAQAGIAHLIRRKQDRLLIGLIEEANPKARLGTRLQAHQAVLTGMQADTAALNSCRQRVGTAVVRSPDHAQNLKPTPTLKR